MAQTEMIRKICVVGGGRWGENHIRTLYGMGNLGGIVESRAERLKELMVKYPGADGFCSMEDAVGKEYDGYVVATPAGTHFQIGSYLLAQNKNVLIEKPLTLNPEDSLKLVRLAEKTGSKLMVGHILLFHPAVAKIKEIIEEGRLGKLLYIYLNRLNLGAVRTQENVFWSFAPHDISILDYLIGKPPVSITASGGCHLQDGIHDTVLAALSYPDNIKAHIFVSWLHPFKEQRLVVTGSRGMLTFEDASEDRKLLFYNKGIQWIDGQPVQRNEGVEVIDYDSSSPLENELRYFMDHLDSEIAVADGRNGYETVRILEKVTKCLDSE